MADDLPADKLPADKLPADKLPADELPAPDDAPQQVEAGFRNVPVVGIGHPLTDRTGTDAAGQGWSATESRARVIFLSALRANFLATLARDGRRPVLITDELSVLTTAFADTWQQAGGTWVVRESTGGLRDGFTGRWLDRIEDSWRAAAPPTSPGIDDVSVNHLRTVSEPSRQITVLLSVRHPARDSSVLGGALEQLSQAVIGTAPTVWGPHEPAVADWNRAELSAAIRTRMPAETAMFVAGRQLSARISAQRTRHGVEELINAVFSVGNPDLGTFERLRARIDEVLEQLSGTAMPLVGLVLSRPGRADLLVAPYLAAPPVPTTLLIGAPAVRAFGLDPAALSNRFGSRAVGRKRIPGVLFGLGAYGMPAWQKLDAILGSLDPDLLQEAMGLAAPALRTLQQSAPAPVELPIESDGDRAEP